MQSKGLRSSLKKNNKEANHSFGSSATDDHISSKSLFKCRHPLHSVQLVPVSPSASTASSFLFDPVSSSHSLNFVPLSQPLCFLFSSPCALSLYKLMHVDAFQSESVPGLMIKNSPVSPCPVLPHPHSLLPLILLKNRLKPLFLG